MQKCTPTENFLRLARPKVFATGANDAKTNAERTIFRLAQPNHKYPPTELFSRLVRPKILTTGANDVKMKADRNFFAWFDQSKKVCGPHFSAIEVTEARATADQSAFASIATEIFSTGVTEAKVSADRSLFAIGATVVQLTAYRNFFATEVTAARMNADRSFFATGASKNFSDWRDWRKSSRRLKFFWLARANYMWPPTDSFCAWRDWNKSARQPKFFWTGASEVHMTVDRFFLRLARLKVFATGAVEVYMSANRNFFEVRWRSKNGCRPKCFRAWRDQKILRLARSMQKCTPTEVFLRLARPNVFATGANDAKMNADRTFIWLTRPKHKYPPTEFFSRLVRPKILTMGANDVKMNADRNFFAWFDQSKIVCGPHFFATEVTEARATADQSVLLLSRQKMFRLAWPKQKFPPTEVYLRLARP